MTQHPKTQWNRCIAFVASIALLAIAGAASANPIPWPQPASMPLEDMYSYLDETAIGLQETFMGDYYFSIIPEDVYMMKYPLPPGSRGIEVMMGNLPEDWDFDPGAFPYLHEMQVHQDPMDWYYIRELYPTVVPEWPGIPMIAWRGPFPEKALLSVNYQHDLLRRGRKYVYFYALGTGKYYQTYQKEAVSYLDISMPTNYDMTEMFLDKTPHAFAVTTERDSHGDARRVVSIYASARFGPFTKDIIGNIREKHSVISLDHTWPLEKSPLKKLHIRLTYAVDQCGGTQPLGIKPDVRASRRNMYVTDQIYFNCCAEYVRMTILVDGNHVIFREKAMEEAPCDCVCYYPMRGVAGRFPPGQYDVELLDPHGNVLVEKEIVIE